ncbi:MAG: biotin--protein ligase [Roseiflexus sp.]
MHGEYKIPGGKLIVVDLDIIDDALRNVVLSGDFFLEPAEALEWMATALEGLPTNTPVETIAGRVRTAAAYAELIGISPEGVAEAVRRAIQGETS